MKVGSLFSGIGGIELGFERQGYRTEWFVEQDLYAQAVLRKNFPETPIYGDIKELDFRTVPKVDILTGGFPCQDISNAGKRVGIEGSRSSLWKYYLDAISILRPRFAFIENVSALLGRGLATVLCDLASIGYDAEWYCVSASSVGAYHERNRIFIIAYTNIKGWERERQEKMGYSQYSCKVSDSPNVGCENWNHTSTSKFSIPEQQRGAHAIGQSCCKTDISNSECFGSPEQRKSREFLCQKKNRAWEADRFNDDGLWSAEPELGRVADGVPNRVDRIRCLGNAVVPQIAEIFAKAIKEK